MNFVFNYESCLKENVKKKKNHQTSFNQPHPDIIITTTFTTRMKSSTIIENASIIN